MPPSPTPSNVSSCDDKPAAANYFAGYSKKKELSDELRVHGTIIATTVVGEGE
jgi:hypothetical protein